MASSSARVRSSRGSLSAGITAELEEQADAEVAGGRLTEEGGGIIAETTTTVDTGVAIIAVDSMPGGEWGGRGRRGDGVVGRAIEGVRQLRHRHGRLRRRHRPSPTSDIVAAVN